MPSYLNDSQCRRGTAVGESLLFSPAPGGCTGKCMHHTNRLWDCPSPMRIKQSCISFRDYLVMQRGVKESVNQWWVHALRSDLRILFLGGFCPAYLSRPVPRSNPTRLDTLLLWRERERGDRRCAKQRAMQVGAGAESGDTQAGALARRGGPMRELHFCWDV